MEGFDSINIDIDPGADVKTDSNHHKSAVDTIGLDYAEKVSFEQNKVITQSQNGLNDSDNKGMKAAQ